MPTRRRASRVALHATSCPAKNNYLSARRARSGILTTCQSKTIVIVSTVRTFLSKCFSHIYCVMCMRTRMYALCVRYVHLLGVTCSGMMVQSVIRLFVYIYLLTLLESVISTVHISFVTPIVIIFWIPLALRTWVHAALSSSSTAYCVCVFFGFKRAQCMPKHPSSLDARKQGGRIAISLDLAPFPKFLICCTLRVYTHVNRIYALNELIRYPYTSFKRLMAEIAYRSVHKFLTSHV